MDIAENPGPLQLALRFQVTPQASARAIKAYHQSPLPFPLGTTPGVLVPVRVANDRLPLELQRLGMVPPTGGVQRPAAQSAGVPWFVRDQSRPRPRARW